MRILIVEDGAFNAFCLTQLLEAVFEPVQVVLAKDSISALNELSQNSPALVILDGHLGASDGLYCNGPALASAIWLLNPQMPIIAWSDSEAMRLAFAEVFKQHNKVFNDYTCWTKVVSQERIRQSLPYLLAQNSMESAANSSCREPSKQRYLAEAIA